MASGRRGLMVGRRGPAQVGPQVQTPIPAPQPAPAPTGAPPMAGDRPVRGNAPVVNPQARRAANLGINRGLAVGRNRGVVRNNPSRGGSVDEQRKYLENEIARRTRAGKDPIGFRNKLAELGSPAATAPETPGTGGQEPTPGPGERPNVDPNTLLSPEGVDKAESEVLAQDIERDLELGDIGEGSLGQVGETYGERFSLDGIGNDPSQFDPTAERSRFETESYNRLSKPVQERQAREIDDFRQRMANEGIPEGSPKYRMLEQQMKDQQTRDLSDIQQRAMEMGGSEMERSFGLGQTARQQGISERLLSRDRPYQELANVLGLRRSPEIGLAERGMSQREREFGQEMSFKQKQARIQNALQRLGISKMGGGGGGGGGGGLEDYFAKGKFQTDEQIRLAQALQALAGEPEDNSPSGGDIFGSIAGSAIGPLIESLFG